MLISAHFAYGSGLAFSSDLEAGAADLRRMEAAGLDAAWVGESYWLDGPTTLGYLAARTSRLRLGSLIMSVYSRSPGLIAQTAAGLDYVSNGRALVGLGVSGPTVVEQWHDAAFERPLQRMTEALRACRAALRRDPMPLRRSEAGRGLRLMHEPVRRAVPLYVAAMGPKMVELAAAEADGWLTNMFLPEVAEDTWGEALARGRARRADDAGELAIVAGGMVAIDGDTLHALDKAKRRIAFYVGAMGPPGRNYYYDLAVRLGYGTAAERIRARMLDKDPAGAAAAVPTEFAEHTNLIGSAALVRERVAAYRKAGVTMLNIVPVAGDPAAVVETIAGWTR